MYVCQQFDLLCYSNSKNNRWISKVLCILISSYGHFGWYCLYTTLPIDGVHLACQLEYSRVVFDRIWHISWDMFYNASLSNGIRSCYVSNKADPYHTSLRHKNTALKLLSIPWLIALIFASIPFIGKSKQFEYYTSFAIITLIPIPCAFIIFSYAKLYFTVRRRNAMVRQSSGTNLSIDQTHMMKMILCMILVFIICWIPITIHYSIQNEKGSTMSKQATRLLHISAKFLSYFNSVCNPVIYALLNPVFKNGFKDVMTNCFYLSRNS